MKIVGLTGGIGSGKTTVANFFQKLGVPIYIADDRSKAILDSDIEVRQKVVELLGEQSYKTVDGEMAADRPFIAQIVFNSESKLNKLNNIIHPTVRADFEVWRDKQDSAYCIYEAAILIESGGQSLCDDIILVTAPMEERIDRVVKRDGSNRAEVHNRIKNQMSDLKKLEFSNYVIYNEEKEFLANYVASINIILLKK